MNLERRFDFYKEQYVLELERKNELTGVVQVRLVTLVSAASIMLYMLKTFQFHHEHIWIPFLFMILASLSGGLFLYIAWSLYKAYWGNTYERLPSIYELESYRVALDSEGILKEDPNAFEEYLIEEMSLCMKNNCESNDSRYQLMNKVMKKLPWAITLFVLSGAIYLIADLDASSPRKPVEVQIIETRNDRQ
ncbi:hypothetical protein AB4291_13675 [Vibrio cyclitrophicus]|uniref:hypothetical protein n=1 Tax=Vibrio cortegadensis TaxID=1328770 RepID=UPI00352E7C2F